MSSNIQRLDKITNVLLIALVAIPFFISFGALNALAAANGVSYPLLYPLMIDGGLLIFKALALRESLRGKRDNYAWGMAIILTIISVGLNIVHVPEELPHLGLARFMSALPPIVILAAFIAVSRRIEEGAKLEGVGETVEQLTADAQRLTADVQRLTEEKSTLESTVSDRRKEASEIDTKIVESTVTVEQLTADIRRLTVDVRQLTEKKSTLTRHLSTLKRRHSLPLVSDGVDTPSDSVDTRHPTPSDGVDTRHSTPSDGVGRQFPTVSIDGVDGVGRQEPNSKEDAIRRLLSYLSDNPDATVTAVSRHVGRSRSTVSGYISELTEGGKLHKNGHGWEVFA